MRVESGSCAAAQLPCSLPCHAVRSPTHPPPAIPTCCQVGASIAVAIAIHNVSMHVLPYGQQCSHLAIMLALCMPPAWDAAGTARRACHERAALPCVGSSGLPPCLTLFTVLPVCRSRRAYVWPCESASMAVQMHGRPAAGRAAKVLMTAIAPAHPHLLFARHCRPIYYSTGSKWKVGARDVRSRGVQVQ